MTGNRKTKNDKRTMVDIGHVIIILAAVMFVQHVQMIPAPRGKYNKQGELIQDDGTLNDTHEQIHIDVRHLRNEASMVVVIVFFSITVGIFVCCRYVPELIMEKCNY